MRHLRIIDLIARIPAAVLLGALLIAAPAAAGEAMQTARHAARTGGNADASQAKAQLQALRGQIARIARQVSRGQAERDRLTRQLRVTEESVGKAQAALDGLRQEREAGAAQRAQLQAQKHRLESDLADNRSVLAGQLRAAYLIGREEPLKLLLNQRDPAQAGRMFVYYSYFGRARALKIQAIEADLQHLGQLDGELQAQDARLSGLQAAQQAQVAALQQARSQRLQVLASISAQTQSRSERLSRLRRQRGDLESLLMQLRRATASLPPQYLGHSPFAKLRGRLLRPVAGTVIEGYGQVRAGGLRWQGDLFATQRDAPVRAVSGGRVVYADWLAGLGLLIIIDHGGGYMSLYGHNDRLYESVGQQVAPGQIIAQAGDSGGSARPELYFEIRRQGEPVDPRLWLKAVR